jgi:DNA-directed RNA polymerase specialized sigma24 family protein
MHKAAPAKFAEQYSDLLRQIDLEGEALQDAASDLGITANNLTVRLHRARQRLRIELERTCRICSRHGCLDCSCEG